MTIRKCTCGKSVTTKNCKPLGKEDFNGKTIFYFNCAHCNSTLVLVSKKPLTPFKAA